MRTRKDAGFSLLEAMIALGIMGIGAYFLISLFKTSSMGQKTLLAQDDARVLTDNMANMLSDPTACADTFGGLDPVNGASVTALKDKSSTTQFQAGGKYGNRGVMLSGVTIGGSGPDPRTRVPRWTPGTIPNTGAAFVSVDWLQTGSPGNQGAGPSHLYRYFMVYVTTLDPATGKIAKCTAQIGGGEVFGAGTPKYLALWKDDGTIGPSALAYETNGNLGVGTTSPLTKLDVAGGLRPGSETQVTACDSSVEGQMRYNYSAHDMEVCGGNPLAWTSLGGGPGSWCGLYIANTGGFNGEFLNGGAGGAVLCHGINPASGCPAGYSQFSACYESDHYHNCNNMVTCIKN